MLLLAKGMKMKTMIRRKTSSKQTKQELQKGGEENLWSTTRKKQMKQELRRGEEANLWRWTSQQQNILFWSITQ
jgi:hypothetical protein